MDKSVILVCVPLWKGRCNKLCYVTSYLHYVQLMYLVISCDVIYYTCTCTIIQFYDLVRLSVAALLATHSPSSLQFYVALYKGVPTHSQVPTSKLNGDLRNYACTHLPINGDTFFTLCMCIRSVQVSSIVLTLVRSNTWGCYIATQSGRCS